MGAPVVFWGASIGPFSQDPEFEEWAVEQLRLVDLICVRETETYNYLQSLGLSENVLLTSDPSFGMRPVPCSLPSDIESLLSERCIGLNFSPLVGDFYGSNEEWIQRVVLSIEQLANQYDGSILLIPHVIDEQNYSRNDFQFMQDVISNLPETLSKRVKLLRTKLSAAQTKWVISRTRIFAGCRTHSTFAAISTHVPTICISYSAKARGIAFDTYENYNWLINGHKLIPEEFAQKVTDMCAQEDSIREHLQLRVPMFQERAQLAGDRVLAIYRLSI
jgi:polysaccharide pyruvyl transferase WcaK-like protein